MITPTPCTNIFVVGPVCSGKTNLINTWLLTENRYVRFDYTGETINFPGVEHFYKPLPLLDRLDKNPYYFRCAYHPGKDVMEHYRWCQRAIWMIDEPRWLVMDEYHRVCPQNRALDEDVEAALRLARHNQLGIIGGTQRPQDVNKLFVDSCRMCVIFRSQEENFLNACAGHWGNDVADAVATMRPLVYDDVSKRVVQVQQCAVVTRDGQAPRIYDFATDQFTPIGEFLNNKDGGNRDHAPLRTDLDPEREPSEELHETERDSD